MWRGVFANICVCVCIAHYKHHVRKTVMLKNYGNFSAKDVAFKRQHWREWGSWPRDYKWKITGYLKAGAFDVKIQWKWRCSDFIDLIDIAQYSTYISFRMQRRRDRIIKKVGGENRGNLFVFYLIRTFIFVIICFNYKWQLYLNE